MAYKLGVNYKFLNKAINSQKWGADENGNPVLVSGYRGCILEGSSRSGKTTDSVDTIIKLCVQSDKPLIINVIKETQENFKTTLYRDFDNRLRHYGIYSPFSDKDQVSSFKIFESRVNFLGCDKASKFDGAGCDYMYLNEMLEVPQVIFDQAEMRCTKFWWGDYNPKVTEHYIYKSIIPRRDVGYLRTTWKTNKYLSPQEKSKILSYSPYDESENVYVENNELYYNGQPISDTNQPKPHPTNIEEGTADMTNYKVLYHGIRCAPEGLIFSNIKYIDEFPELDYIYGNDFGFTVDPNALVKYAQEGRNIYVELLAYDPIADPETLDELFKSLGVEKNKMIIADSSDKYTAENKGTVEMVYMMQEKGYEMHKVSKKRSIMFWLNKMKSYKIHIVRNSRHQEARIEVDNYKLKTIHGIRIEQPDDKCKDHFIDAMRYCFMAYNLYL